MRKTASPTDCSPWRAIASVPRRDGCPSPLIPCTASRTSPRTGTAPCALPCKHGHTPETRGKVEKSWKLLATVQPSPSFMWRPWARPPPDPTGIPALCRDERQAQQCGRAGWTVVTPGEISAHKGACLDAGQALALEQDPPGTAVPAAWPVPQRGAQPAGMRAQCQQRDAAFAPDERRRGGWGRTLCPVPLPPPVHPRHPGADDGGGRFHLLPDAGRPGTAPLRSTIASWPPAPRCTGACRTIMAWWTATARSVSFAAHTVRRKPRRLPRPRPRGTRPS